METRDVIDRYYELLAARDRDGLVTLFAPDFKVTYHAQPDAFPWSGVFEGIDGFDRFLAVIAEHLEIVEVDQTATIADGERVVVQCAGHWRVKANGADVKGGMVNVFTVADGRIAHYEVHADTHAFATALEGV
jgi:ketosteroid isomerase-like protein